MRTVRRVVVWTALAVVAFALFAACGDDNDAAAEIEGVDPAALLREAADRMELAQSLHFLLEHENGATEIVRGLRMQRAEGDIVGSDRLSVEIRATVGPLNLKVGIVIIGDEAWITNPITGRWEREQISIEGVFAPATGVTALMRLAADPRVAGSDTIGGVRTYRVEVTVDSGDVTMFGQPRAGRALRAKVWIGIDDSLVYRIEIVGSVLAGEPDDLMRRVTFSRFDTEIEIAPPR